MGATSISSKYYKPWALCKGDEHKIQITTKIIFSNLNYYNIKPVGHVKAPIRERPTQVERKD